MVSRLRALDALRGVLAAFVVFAHVGYQWGLQWPLEIAPLCVLIFFGMSGFVLCRAYDDRYLAFLARRAVRLYPVWWLCLAVAAALLQRAPTLAEVVLWPSTLAAGLPGLADPPSWSLVVEIAATPFLPVAFWAVRSQARLVLIVLPLASLPGRWGLWGLCFVVGAALTRVEWGDADSNLRIKRDFVELYSVYRVCVRRSWIFLSASYSIRCIHFNDAFVSFVLQASAAAVFLGRISYSLYATHWLVLMLACAALGPYGPAATLALAPLVALGVHEWLDRRAVRWSRFV